MGCEYSVPIATADDFQYVHPKPPLLLADNIQPAPLPGQVFHLKMKRKIWRTWTKDSFGVRYAIDGRPFEANVKGALWSVRDRMTLRHYLTGEPIAVLLKMFGRWERTFKVYSFRPLFLGQVPSNQQSDDGRPLYTWGEVIDSAYSVQYRMTTLDGAVYIADRVGAVLGPLQMKLTRNGRTAAMVGHESMFTGFYGPVWDIQIAPGIDPCMILCFTAIVDELIELQEEQQ